MREATTGFADEKLVGKGGFGRVFRGRLRHSDVAVKVLNTRGVQSIMRAKSECLLNTEVAALTRYRHPNLIELMGYCRAPPALVYPYMHRGSLYKNLHEWKVEEPLTWSQRLSVLTDTCRALAYLHSEVPPVIHHDVNSSNILLDKQWFEDTDNVSRWLARN
jgi:serine/threonine protein kinase